MNIFEIFENKKRVSRSIPKINEGIGPDQNDPWEQGWRANPAHAENPYPQGTKEHAQWEDGQAERRAQPRHYDEGVAEATGAGQFDSMMKKVTRTPTAKARNAERIRQKSERQADSRRRAADVFGTSPADKLSIKKSQQGVAEGRAGVDDTDTVGFSVNSEAAYTAVMRRFGDVIDHDETSGIMYAPARVWPQIEMVAFDADGEGATRDDGIDENLRDWFGKEKWVRMDTKGNIKGDCARGSEKEGKPKCLPQAKAHALGKKGRASAAQKKRREDPNPERRGAAINVATKVREQDDLDEACWKGYHKEGMKTMFGKKYPNCVKNKNESLETYIKRNECPGCGGLMVSESQLTEKKDACYHKVKSRYKVWPSAYASGALVRCRKVGADGWGNKSESATEATNPAQQAAIAISKKKKAELTEEAKAQVIDAVADFYKNQLAQSEPGEVSDYKAQAKKLLAKADEKQRSKVLDMLQAGLKNPYLQGAIITIVGSLVSGAVIKHFSSMGLSPQQFNMVLQGAMNSVIPTLAAKLHGMGWSDAIKTGLASVGVGVGAAGVLEAERNEMDTPAVQAALKNMAARHNKEQWSTEQLAALGKRLAAAAQDKKSAKSAEESGMEEDQWSDGSDQWSDGKGQWSDGRGQWSESIDADIADYLTEMKNAGYDIK